MGMAETAVLENASGHLGVEWMSHPRVVAFQARIPLVWPNAELTSTDPFASGASSFHAIQLVHPRLMSFSAIQSSIDSTGVHANPLQ